MVPAGFRFVAQTTIERAAGLCLGRRRLVYTRSHCLFSREETRVAKRKGLVINDRQLDVCDEILRKLKEVSGSTFLALISTSGQPITTASDEYHPETLSLASLAASSFAATQQLAKILDETEFTLLFHEGRALNLHVSQVSDQVLLIVTFGRETQVGKVRLYTQRAIDVLKQIFENADEENDALSMDDDYEASAGRVIDLFKDVEGGLDAAH
jgi:predicted regulator of Ras-like GTPase activity (Roadblock/LC7/MglB family)